MIVLHVELNGRVMPEFFKNWLKSLTDEQANELALYFDESDSEDAVDILSKTRHVLYKNWNIQDHQDSLKVVRDK